MFTGVLTVTTAAFQNPADPLDVNADAAIEPLDSVLIANALTAHFGVAFPASELTGAVPREYLDVNGDNMISHADFDAVTNYLNQSGPTGPVCGSETPEFPTAVDDFADTSESAPVQINLLQNDLGASCSSISVVSVSEASNGGTVSLGANGMVLYDPNGQFAVLASGEFATDTFNYTITDSLGNEDQGLVNVTIHGVNAPLIARNDSYKLVVDRSIALNPTANDEDPEGNPLDIILVDAPLNGEFIVTGGAGTYVPNSGLHGDDQFTYRLSNGTPGGISDIATVTLTILDPVSIENGDSREVKVIEILGIQATTYFDSPSFQESVTTSPSVLNHQQLKADAIEVANVDWEVGEQARFVEMESQNEMHTEALNDTLAIETASLESTLNANQSQLQAELDARTAAKEQSYEQSALQFDAATSGIVLNPLGNVTVQVPTTTTQDLLTLQDSLTTPVAQLSTATANAQSSFNAAAASARANWQTPVLGSAAQAIQESWNDEQTLLTDVNAAAVQFTDNLVVLLQGFAEQINDVIVGTDENGLYSKIESHHAAYLDAVREAKEIAEQNIENVVAAKRNEILDAYAAYYQVLAQYQEHSRTEREVKEVVRDTDLEVLAIKQANDDDVRQHLDDFVTAEQSAMVEMVSAIAADAHDALLLIGDHAQELQDSIADESQTLLVAESDALEAFDQKSKDQRHAFAQAFTNADSQYRLSLYNAAVDREATLLTAKQAAIAAQLATLDQFVASRADPTTNAGVIADVNTVANAGLIRQSTGIQTHSSYIQDTTAAEVLKITGDFTAESGFADAAIAAVGTADVQIIDSLADYERDVNQLDRDWLETATAFDVALASAIADALKEKTVAAFADAAASDDVYDQYVPYLTNDFTIDQWPLTLATLPSDVLPILQPTLQELVAPKLLRGTIDISAAEEAFGPHDSPDPVELNLEVDNDTPDEPESLPNRDILAQPDDHSLPTSYVDGQEIWDGEGNTGNLIGTVVIDANGKIRVRRDNVMSGLPLSCNVGAFSWYRDLADVKNERQTFEESAFPEGANDWDDFFRRGGDSPAYWDAYRACQAVPTPNPNQVTSIFDVMPAWMLSALGGQAGSGFDNVLNGVDQFAAGMSSTVTGGITDSLRETIYGEIATKNHDGALYTAGQIAGIAPALAVSAMGGATALHGGLLVKASRTLTAVQTTYDFYGCNRRSGVAV